MIRCTITTYAPDGSLMCNGKPFPLRVDSIAQVMVNKSRYGGAVVTMPTQCYTISEQGFMDVFTYELTEEQEK